GRSPDSFLQHAGKCADACGFPRLSASTNRFIPERHGVLLTATAQKLANTVPPLTGAAFGGGPFFLESAYSAARAEPGAAPARATRSMPSKVWMSFSISALMLSKLAFFSSVASFM